MTFNDTPKARASELAEALREAAQKNRTVAGVGGLTVSLVAELESSLTITDVSSSVGKAAGNGRGSTAYWRDHGLLTERLMVRIAERWGGNRELYCRVGRLHDIDYLAFPHDAPGVGDRHPVPLVRAMMKHGVHAAICLAVLEHAPYTGFDRTPSSRLSAALSAAEDLATLAALVPPSDVLEQLSEEARALLTTVEPKEYIRRDSDVRVEVDIERYVNIPLALVAGGGAFAFDV